MAPLAYDPTPLSPAPQLLTCALPTFSQSTYIQAYIIIGFAALGLTFVCCMIVFAVREYMWGGKPYLSIDRRGSVIFYTDIPKDGIKYVEQESLGQVLHEIIMKASQVKVGRRSVEEVLMAYKREVV